MSETHQAVQIAVRTDIGQKRTENQDYISSYTNEVGLPLLVLADGMGGHRAGNIASQMAATLLGEKWRQSSLTDLSAIRRWLQQEIETVNRLVHEKGLEEQYRGMGTTIEAVVVAGHVALYGHVGDSRIGLYHEGSYQQVTNDHSLVNELVQAGQLTEEEAQHHPQKNIITQSIGQPSPVVVDVGVETLVAGDILVVNSDGLTNMISKEQLEEVLSQADSLDDKTKALIGLANQAGGLDNISVGLILAESEG
ncbi:Protein serine/threonine phosphatase PrpC, regulation of stationary phase [Streptococcus sp. DD12]|nr:Protein serine/threonine phosphatase PrpC, regulation of stationary phase [Streptococcus sp. DD12]